MSQHYSDPTRARRGIYRSASDAKLDRFPGAGWYAWSDAKDRLVGPFATEAEALADAQRETFTDPLGIAIAEKLRERAQRGEE